MVVKSKLSALTQRTTVITLTMGWDTFPSNATIKDYVVQVTMNISIVGLQPQPLKDSRRYRLQQLWQHISNELQVMLCHSNGAAGDKAPVGDVVQFQPTK